LDARRCISYLTIELKGSIPLELRPAIGNRIYGCDDCLAVCPWNRFAQEGRLMKASARPELAEPDLLELLSLDEAAFKKRFAGTAILRAKRRGFLRNVCVALGNIGDESASPLLPLSRSLPSTPVGPSSRFRPAAKGEPRYPLIDIDGTLEHFQRITMPALHMPMPVQAGRFEAEGLLL
jgi:epoxyqueuosine reductase